MAFCVTQSGYFTHSFIYGAEFYSLNEGNTVDMQAFLITHALGGSESSSVFGKRERFILLNSKE
jgi:hypothetical protein